MDRAETKQFIKDRMRAFASAVVSGNIKAAELYENEILDLLLDKER